MPEVTPARDACRRGFGDDREDYQQAIERHYAEGAPNDREQRFVSAYATMHPWEDWAETFAHYLHIRDTLQTAGDGKRRAGQSHELHAALQRAVWAVPGGSLCPGGRRFRRRSADALPRAAIV